MKKVYILMISLLSLQGFSQKSNLPDVTNEEFITKLKPTTDVEFLSLLQKSVNFYTSEEFVNNKKLKAEFSNKVGNTYTKVQCTSEEFKNWITENVLETKFKSVAEGVAAFNKVQGSDKIIRLKESSLLDESLPFYDKYGDEVMSLYRAFIATLVVGN